MKLPFTEGPLNPTIALIGEAPGTDEANDPLQRPFVGQSGTRILNPMLQSAGLLREKCYITNVLKWKLPENDFSDIITFPAKKKGQRFAPPIIKDSRYFEAVDLLARELAQVQCNVLVPLGQLSLFALTGKTKATSYAGSILPCTLQHNEGRKVVPSIHPAFALRESSTTPPLRHILRMDLHRAKLEAERGPAIQLLQRSILTNPTFTQVIDYINQALASPLIVCDLETDLTTKRITHFGIALSATNAISIPFYKRTQHSYTSEEEWLIWKSLAQLMTSQSVVKIFHNTSFDISVLHRDYGIVVSPIEDTMVGMGVIHPDFPKGLDFYTHYYGEGEPYYKDEGKEWNPFDFDDEEFQLYNGKDCCIPFQGWGPMLAEADSLNNLEAYANQRNLIPPLVYMANRGIQMDTFELTRLQQQTKAEMDFLEWQVQVAANNPTLNLGSDTQMKNLLYKKWNLPIQKKRRKGKEERTESSDKTALSIISTQHHHMVPWREGLDGKEQPVTNHIMKYNSLKTRLNTFYEVPLSSDGRMRCSYNPVGTTSGRLSSSANILEEGANMQNQPREMKRAMLPDPGHIMVNVDLAQAEFVVVAYIAGEQSMIKVIESGGDPHRNTASDIFGISPELVSDDPYSAGIPGSDLSQRAIGKKSNHALNYDEQAKTFAESSGLPLKFAKKVVNLYHQGKPGIRNTFHEFVRGQLNLKHRLTDCFGKTRTFKKQINADAYRVGYSFIPQATVVHVINQWGLNYLYYNQEEFHSVDLLNQVHDSILFQIPITAGIPYVARVLRLLQGSLEQQITAQITGLPFHIKTDFAFSFKNAKDMIDIPRNTLLSSEEEVVKQLNEGYEEFLTNTKMN